MPEKETYIERSLIKLNRKYGKDELVASLNKQLSEKDVEIGQLKSEILHLEHLLNGTDDEKEQAKQAKKEVRKEQMYKSILTINANLTKQVKTLKNMRDELLAIINSK